MRNEEWMDWERDEKNADRRGGMRRWEIHVGERLKEDRGRSWRGDRRLEVKGGKRKERREEKKI
jgi:hypothetical protein